MLRLSVGKAPYWIDLVGDVSVEVKPPSSLMMLEVREGVEMPDGGTDFSGPAFILAYGKAVARAAIIGWKGVLGAEDQDAAVTAENIDALMDIYQCYLAFRDRYIGPALTLAAEGNVSAPSPNGTSAAAQTTAQDAMASAPNVPAVKTSH